MRPKPTHRDGRHPSATAKWGAPAADAPPEIAGLVSFGRTARQWRGDIASSADVRATLEVLSRVQGDDAARQALRDCDAMTHAELLRSLACAPADVTAQAVRDAATHALAHPTETPRGRRNAGYQHALAEMIVQRWMIERDGAVPTAWHSTEYGTSSELVAHAGVIFDLVEERSFDRSKLAELLRGAISTLIQPD